MTTTIRNPVFWGEVSVPLLLAAQEGETAVRVVLVKGDRLSEIEIEVRVIRVGKTRIPKVLRRSHLKELER